MCVLVKIKVLVAREIERDRDINKYIMMANKESANKRWWRQAVKRRWRARQWRRSWATDWACRWGSRRLGGGMARRRPAWAVRTRSRCGSYSLVPRSRRSRLAVGTWSRLFGSRRSPVCRQSTTELRSLLRRFSMAFYHSRS